MDHIYIISAAKRYCKIGRARLPRERFTSLENGSPLPLTFEYLCELEDGTDIERLTHNALADHHSHREWFTVAPAKAVLTVRMVISNIGLECRPPVVANGPRGRGAPRKIVPKITETTVF